MFIKARVFIFFQDVDAVVGKFSAVGTVVMIWTDQSLSWNTADHNGIASIVIPSSDIWNPTLVMANSYSRFSSLNADWTNTRVYSYGVVLSAPAAAFHSACTVNVKYYPYDKQVRAITGYCTLTPTSTPF